MGVGLAWLWLEYFLLDLLVAAIFILPLIVFSLLFVLPLIALFHLLHLELSLVIRVFLVFVIILLSILYIVQVALFYFFLLFGIGMDLVEEEVASSLDLLQHIGWNLILADDAAIDRDFLHVCQLTNDHLPLLLGETGLL